MEYTAISDFKNRESYFKNIALKASELCIKDYDSSTLTDEDKDCIKNASIKLHHIAGVSPLERWAAEPSKRPYEEYWWIRSKY